MHWLSSNYRCSEIYILLLIFNEILFLNIYFGVDTKDKVAPLTKEVLFHYFIPDCNQKLNPYSPEDDPAFPLELKSYNRLPINVKGTRSEWFAPTTLQDILELKAIFISRFIPTFRINIRMQNW